MRGRAAHRREGLPDDGLADVGRDEERDAGAEAVALLEQLVEDEHDDAGAEELQDDQRRVAVAQLRHRAVHAGCDVGDGLADGDDDAKELLGALEEHAVLLEAVVDLDDLGARQELHDHAGRDDRRDAQLHQRAAVGGEDDAHPVERVGRLGGLDAVERDLAADEEDEQRDRRPQDLLPAQSELCQRQPERNSAATERQRQVSLQAEAAEQGAHRKGILRSAAATSGCTDMKGRTSERKRKPPAIVTVVRNGFCGGQSVLPVAGRWIQRRHAACWEEERRKENSAGFYVPGTINPLP